MKPFWNPGLVMLGAVCVLGLFGVAHGQSLDSEPISIDVIEGQANAPILVAAYSPPANTAPIFGTAGAGRDAVLVRPGLPAPSIILGRVQPGQEPAFGIARLLPETVRQVAFAYNDLDARIQLRSDDPELLRLLIEQGHIDPPDDVLNTALQTELQRMNCYRSGIDGAWGPGSRRSVDAYFDERDDGATWPEQEPSVELYREIILYEDVRCPTPQAAPARTTARRPAATAQPAPAPARRPAPVAPSNKPKISSGTGIGVFR